MKVQNVANYDVFLRIESMLRDQHKTMADLCKHLKISTNMGTEWRHKRSVSYMKYLPIIAMYLGTTEAVLMGEEPEEVEESPAIAHTDDDLVDIINAVHTRPELRMLFSASKNATADDVLRAVKIIESLKDYNGNV